MIQPEQLVTNSISPGQFAHGQVRDHDLVVSSNGAKTSGPRLVSYSSAVRGRPSAARILRWRGSFASAKFQSPTTGNAGSVHRVFVTRQFTIDVVNDDRVVVIELDRGLGS